eukprot:CAMPEP_0198229910 /NCGR_PEP_ID=MMETSP1445-20131203/114372_1 /TAXON_ID=36898 /ORGANISM="Pyramimonas sp., Strain CCMP2087" /LENGTH=644 /DNA_ID=CAMNT_0043910395 /DNA_START=375 /DNA_END=2305 /DNA_ORIENTATION=-
MSHTGDFQASAERPCTTTSAARTFVRTQQSALGGRLWACALLVLTLSSIGICVEGQGSVSNGGDLTAEAFGTFSYYGLGVPTEPSEAQTVAPTTGAPTTGAPTTSPTLAPTSSPTGAPTASPTAAPTIQTVSPTSSPTTTSPTVASNATAAPTTSPTAFSNTTLAPTAHSTVAPTASPTASPTSPFVPGSCSVRALQFDTVLNIPAAVIIETSAVECLGAEAMPGLCTQSEQILITINRTLWSSTVNSPLREATANICSETNSSDSYSNMTTLLSEVLGASTENISLQVLCAIASASESTNATSRRLLQTTPSDEEDEGAIGYNMFSFYGLGVPTEPSTTEAQTVAPTTAAPTTSPTLAPTSSPTGAPTASPTAAPTVQTVSPTSSPTTTSPTVASNATAAPTTSPTAFSNTTLAPTAHSTVAPTASPTASPTSPFVPGSCSVRALQFDTVLNIPAAVIIETSAVECLGAEAMPGLCTQSEQILITINRTLWSSTVNSPLREATANICSETNSSDSYSNMTTLLSEVLGASTENISLQVLCAIASASESTNATSRRLLQTTPSDEEDEGAIGYNMFSFYGLGVPTEPSTTEAQTVAPTTGAPTTSPTLAPTSSPTGAPTASPTAAPTVQTVSPTSSPTTTSPTV